MTNPPAIADNRETTPSPALASAIGKLRTCPNCSEEFAPPIRGPGGHKRFCSTDCRRGWDYRAKVEGAAIVTIAKIWRQSRGSGDLGKQAFARLTEALDLLNANDEKEGRHRLNPNGPLAPYIKSVLADPYLDRRRR